MSLISPSGYNASYYESLTNSAPVVGSGGSVPNVEVISEGGKCCGKGTTTVRTSNTPGRTPITFGSTNPQDLTYPIIINPTRGNTVVPPPSLGDWLSNLFSGKPTNTPRAVSLDAINPTDPQPLFNWKDVFQGVLVALLVGGVMYLIKRYGK